jgi:hypothetical protein
MGTSRLVEVVEHLWEYQLDSAIDEAQKADETSFVWRLCFIKNLYFDGSIKIAARRVCVSPYWRSVARRVE